MKKTILLLSLASLLLLGACGVQSTADVGAGGGSQQTEQAKVTKLTAEQAHERMQSGAPIVVLDVRTEDEYAQIHIPGAILLPNEQIGSVPPEVLPVLDTEILVYCRSGNRSANAAAKLLAMGYSKIFDFGGINDWEYEKESGEYQAPEKSGTLSSFLGFDLNGIMVDESVFKDYDITMINIWATFCGPCIREMPELGKLAAEYADNGVRIVGIVADVGRNENGTFSMKNLQMARDIVTETGADYLHILPSADLISAKLGQVSAVPETIFVDSEGKLVGESYIGSRSGAAWAEIIDAVLAEVKK